MQYHHCHQNKISLIGEIGKVKIEKGKNRKKPNRRFWIRPGKTDEWWQNFSKGKLYWSVALIEYMLVYTVHSVATGRV